MELLNKYSEILEYFGYTINTNGLKKRNYIYREKDRFTIISWEFTIEIHTMFSDTSNIKDVDININRDLQGLQIYSDKIGRISYIAYNCTSIEDMINYLYKLHPEKARLEKLKRILWENI